MSTTVQNHPPDTRQRELEHLETALPRLGFFERIALRVAMRAVLRLERFDREAALRRHELVLDNERRRMAADRAVLLQRPFG
ncbi:MAG TPA: hypothetical protein VNQ52_11060 [Microbacteriaceae bacterium]|nr:hypothetical protein [Microbacteriaceae bacterium]